MRIEREVVIEQCRRRERRSGGRMEYCSILLPGRQNREQRIEPAARVASLF